MGLNVYRSACAWRRRIGTVAMILSAALLQACGGTAGDAEPPPPDAKLPELSGRVTNGRTPTNVGALQITVKGSVGTARTAEGRLAPIDGSDYLASLDQLSAPYLLTDSADSSFGGLYSVATGPGTANLTPLTSLLVAELLGTEPLLHFKALGARGGFTGVDDASIAAAEARVRRYLKREFDFDVPDAVGRFVTTPFQRTAGDPMFDTITSLATRIGSEDDFRSAVTALAQESARCKAESVAASAAAQTIDLCPFAKTNEVDRGDSTVRVHSIATRHGDVLTLRLRGTLVVDVQLATAEGITSRCSGLACTGVTVGTPAADGTQAIGFAATPLGGAGGRVVLDGSIRSSVPGIALPGLPCTTNRYYLIHVAAGSAEGYCATPDDFGLGGAGQSLPSGATRRTYTFGDGAGGPSVEVVVEGGTVVRALVYGTDPDTGVATALYQCRSASCAGVTLGLSSVDESLGVPIVLQPIRFDRAVLAAVLPDGTLSTTDSVTLEADFTGVFVNDPNAAPLLPVACSATTPTIQVQPSDQAGSIAVCDPDDTQGFQLRSTSIDGDGNTIFSAANLLSDGAGSSSGNTILVTVTPAGAIVSVTFDQFNGPRYQCLAAACRGVAISEPEPTGERTITFDATVLRELGTAGLPADRNVTLGGSTVGLPPP